ncbi:GntR family transcriptional regulator [Ensifer sp. ENS06]|uniref:GntR family transcriptional regulator n=1 Tax=Ensifer sp. ENS06 TaxID=2769276 RepID=UPI0017866EF7|nr:GntR family transcriptional regulator [Ensifer sp. ENS06]MBD9627080.1 GntR family transcriptional regulator [Ensifer sp. ENS06]
MKTKTGKKSAKDGSGGPKTLSETAYGLLKDRLISAKYVPGQFLQETQITADLGLGRTPVNHALHRLQQEGLVEIIPRKGILVRAESLTEIYVALEARMVVEPYCAGLCAERLTAANLEELEKISAEYERVRITSDKARLMELDRQFHTKIAEISGNNLIADFLRSVHERMSRIWFLPLWQFHDFSLTGNEHDSILNTIRERDGNAAKAAMAEHIESLRQRIMAAVV